MLEEVIGVTFHIFRFLIFSRGFIGGDPPKKIQIKIDQKSPETLIWKVTKFKNMLIKQNQVH